MRRVFADANYWIGLLLPQDNLHASAKAASVRLGTSRLVTSEMVLVEVLNGLSRFPALRDAAARTVDAIKADPNIEVVPQTALLFGEALAFFRSHQDKEWGMTDCASFVIMWRMGLREALTHDRHFEQAGFSALMRP